MSILLTSLGLEVVERLDDLDFEPVLLPARMRVVGSPTTQLIRLAGRSVAAGARTCARVDTVMFVARSRR